MNDRVRRICVLPIISGLFFSSSVFAFEAVYNAGNNSVEITGENNFDEVAVAIMPYEYTVESLSDDIINSSGDILFKITEAGGKYADTILLSDNMKEGKYRVTELIDGNGKNSVFIRMEADIINGIVAAANSGEKQKFTEKTKQAFGNLSLGLSGELISQLANKLYLLKPNEGYTVENFCKSLTALEGLMSFRSGLLSFENYMEEYAANIDNVTAEEYNNLTTEQKAEIESCAAGIDFSKGSIQDNISEIIFTGKMHSAQNFGNLKSVVEEYRKNNQMTLDIYDSLKEEYQKNNVFIKLFDIKKQITNAENAAKFIEDFAREEKNKADKNQKPSSGPVSGSTGGGGGSSGGGGSVSGTVSGNTQGDVNAGKNNDEKITDLFSDISGHWGEEYIKRMNELGIVNGFEDKTFRPDNGVTRAEFIKMLVSVIDIPSGEKCSFDDVSESDWYFSYVSDAVTAGIVSGISLDRFAPNDGLTRQDAAVMVYRSISDALTASVRNIKYADENEISDYAIDAVKALSEAGIVKGSDGRYNPEDGITRAEAAVLLLRVHDIMREA